MCAAKIKPCASKRAEELLEMVGLLKFRDHLPHQLSGGMRHRIAIIRTLANAPEILLADEPFTALDEHTRRKLQEDFYELVSRTRQTVIFVTHNIEEAIFLADRAVINKFLLLAASNRLLTSIYPGHATFSICNSMNTAEYCLISSHPM